MVYHRLPAFFLVHGFCSFCKDSDKLRCRDDPWDVVGLSCLGVSPAGDANVSEELKEVARLCMLRDFDSLAFTSDSFVTCKIRGFHECLLSLSSHNNACIYIYAQHTANIYSHATFQWPFLHHFLEVATDI